jgi:putative glycosyltransferase (TIGR04372 family)
MGMMNLARRAIRVAAIRCRMAEFRLWDICCATLPTRWAFNLLMIVSLFGRGHGSWMAPRFASFAVRTLAANPDFSFLGTLTKLSPLRGAYLLFRAGVYAQGADILISTALTARSAEAASLLSALLFEQEDFEGARQALSVWYSGAEIAQWRGLLELLAGNEDAAATFLMVAADAMPHLARPHQNLAARYSTEYNPNSIDIISGREGRLYDFYNYLGQRVTHVGAGHLAVDLYEKAFNAQRELRSASSPELSARLQSIAQALGIHLPDLEVLKILPDEWVTQIGHLGMLDVLFKMRRLGWWDGKAVLLAAYEKIANQPYLSLFDEECHIVTLKNYYENRVFGELSSLQRFSGLSFNAFRMPNGTVLPWQDAGALLTREWEAQQLLDHPTRDRYDRQVATRTDAQSAYAALRKEAGMEPGDWFVCLHMRDANYYGEVEGTGQTHRNAAVQNYVSAIQYITHQGGYVIKLGGKASPILPKMERLFDYSQSKFKSDILDLHLIRQGRYFIGTTSGLTHVPLSFGVPCALVNCVTIDAQLWGKEVRFALKPILTRDGRMLTQRALTSTPWRWRVFSANVMMRYGVKAIENTSDEILETVKEVQSIAADNNDSYRQSIPGASSLLSRWRASLEVPYFYGNAEPSLFYINKYSESFLDADDQLDAPRVAAA